MAWTPPKTWVAGVVLTADDMNDHVRDNMIYLFERPEDAYDFDEAGNWTTTATAWVDVDATDLSLEITTEADYVEVNFHGVFSISLVDWLHLDIKTVGGAREGGDGGISGFRPSAANDRFPISFSRRIGPLTPGTHTFKLQWKVGSGTGSLYNASSGNSNVVGQFWVQEI